MKKRPKKLTAREIDAFMILGALHERETMRRYADRCKRLSTFIKHNAPMVIVASEAWLVLRACAGLGVFPGVEKPVKKLLSRVLLRD